MTVILLLVVLLWMPSLGMAQLNPLGGIAGGDQPMELESDQGLELHQDRQMIVARGNVVVRQGDVRLRADIVSASYRENNGRRSIHRVDALGNVNIKTDSEQIYGGHAVYELDKELFVLKGQNLRIESERQLVTAEDSLEYWGREKRAVARGDASVTQKSDNTRMRAEVIEVRLAPRVEGAQPPSGAPPQGDLELSRVRAWGHVVIRTESEVVEGNEGSYDASKKVATLEGDVRITRGKNQLRGEKAVVDLENGISRLVAAPGERVRSVFYPGSADPERSDAEEPRSLIGTPDKPNGVPSSAVGTTPGSGAKLPSDTETVRPRPRPEKVN